MSVVGCKDCISLDIYSFFLFVPFAFLNYTIFENLIFSPETSMQDRSNAQTFSFTLGFFEAFITGVVIIKKIV